MLPHSSGFPLYACDLFVGKGVDRKGLNLLMLQKPFTLSGEFEPACGRGSTRPRLLTAVFHLFFSKARWSIFYSCNDSAIFKVKLKGAQWRWFRDLGYRGCARWLVSN
jgi:hypothetical protein